MADLDEQCAILHKVLGPHQPHRRGDFATCKFGFSYGLGQDVSLLVLLYGPVS